MKKTAKMRKELRSSIKGRLEDIFDVNYAVSEIHISTMDEWNRQIYKPFLEGAPIYYRGEKQNSLQRRLIPTYFRDTHIPFFENSMQDGICTIDSKKLFSFYEEKKNFMSVFETLYGKPSYGNMYHMLAFAQHYLDVSPFIDLTKSLYVALSFALKGRQSFAEDIVLYTTYDIGDDDSTTDIEEVEDWIANYKVHILRTDLAEQTARRFAENHPDKEVFYDDLRRFQKVINSMSPTAKLIDIPTNDLMKYQQGVFLLLNDYSLIDSSYLTKAVRQSFIISKYVIAKELCPELLALLRQKTPQYKYDCLLDIAQAVKD